MKQKKDNIILIAILILFFFLFKNNAQMRSSIISSCELWFSSLVPSILSMFIVVDLAINYGLAGIFYKIFKNNLVLLIVLCLLLGTPTSIKYIKDFYLKGYITREEAECLLASVYSPNPLFILSISPSIEFALSLLGFIYITNIILFIVFRRKNNGSKSSFNYEKISFSKCLTNSINKSFNVLIIVLGTIIFFGLINTLIGLFISKDNIFIYSIIEITNAIKIINSIGAYKWLIFTISFAGLSIHGQIKSILDDTDLNYKHFLFGRIIASIISLLVIVLD